MSRHWKLDLTSAVRRVLPRRFGGTGNEHGYAAAVVQPFPNGANASLPLGTVVAFKAAFDDRRIVAAQTADGTDVLGVVVGTFSGDWSDEFTATAPAAAAMAAVMTAGVCSVIIGAAVVRGEYAYVHSTDGAAKSSGSVTSGAFGRFVATSASGTALVSVGVFTGSAPAASVTFGTPALTLGTANAAGSIAEHIRRDATVLAFDATTPTAGTIGGSGAVGVAVVAARRDHAHAITGALDAISDVTAPSPAPEDHLVWTGAAWVNQPPAAAALIWRPLMDGSTPGDIVLDGGTGEAIMALGPP